MSTIKSNVKSYDNLMRAASFDADRTYPALFQYLGYRKRIAEQLLHEIDEQRIKELIEVYNKVNAEILLIIGIRLDG